MNLVIEADEMDLLFDEYLRAYAKLPNIHVQCIDSDDREEIYRVTDIANEEKIIYRLIYTADKTLKHVERWSGKEKDLSTESMLNVDKKRDARLSEPFLRKHIADKHLCFNKSHLARKVGWSKWKMKNWLEGNSKADTEDLMKLIQIVNDHALDG